MSKEEAVVAPVIPSAMDAIVFDSKIHANINYVKARCAIDEAMPNREQKRAAKFAVIEFLGGTLTHKTVGETLVVFPDNSKARF